ncbi:MAG: hypothetical protein GTO60_16565 [Gammaproteobacteria bacterium]|nr:hypothetical protein [Gammaproteobacteria bacterium]
MNKKQYQAYLQSDHWFIMRRKALKKAGFKCEQCGLGRDALPLHVHHLNYDNLGNEKPEDLQVLCAYCHRFEHEKANDPILIWVDQYAGKNIVEDSFIFCWGDEDFYPPTITLQAKGVEKYDIYVLKIGGSSVSGLRSKFHFALEEYRPIYYGLFPDERPEPMQLIIDKRHILRSYQVGDKYFGICLGDYAMLMDHIEITEEQYELSQKWEAWKESLPPIPPNITLED